MFIDEPYFMKNDKWYYFDFEDRMYKLTSEAPEKANKSYEEYINYFNKTM